MPATIKQNLDAIKAAVYGEEVRTAIHDSIEQCYKDTTEGKTLAEDAADKANTAASNADTARRNAQAVVDGAVTAINDAAAQQRQSVNDLGDQLKSYMSEHYSETITKAEAKANRSSVSAVKHAIGADGKLTLTDALNEPAKKMTIHLEPKQDLHGYDRPWIGGTGKNLLPPIGNTATWANNANCTYTATDEQLTIVMTDDVSSGIYTKGDSDIRNVIAGLNGVYTWSIDLKAAKSVKIVVGVQGISTSTVSVGTDWQRFNGTGTFTGTSYPFVIYNNGGSGTATTVYARNIMIESGSSATTYEPYSNICPIEGFDTVEIASAGKNLLPQFGEKWVNGSTANWIACVKSGNAPTYPFTFVTSGEAAYTNVPVCAILCLPNTDYTITPPANMKAVVTEYETIADVTDSGKAIKTWQSTAIGYTVGSITRKTAVNAHALVVAFSNWSGSTSITLQKNEEFQLELGQTATTYEPYYGDSISFNLISSAGSTVYGGTVTVNEDGSGTLVVDTCIEDMGEINWSYNNDGRFKGAMKNQIKGYGTVDARTVDFACSCYDVISDSSPYNGALNGIIYYAATMLWAQDNRYTDSEQYRSAMSGQTVAYPLNVPITYQLTATQIQTVIGTNHIRTDGTSLELDYYADRYGKVERLLAAFPKDTVSGDFVTFTDGADGLPVESLEATIEPKQYLHGYDHPWVGGAGKNLLRSFTNKSFLVTGIRIRTLDDGSLWVSGKATDTVEASFVRVPRDTTKTYLVNGCPSGGSTSTYRIIVRLFEGNLMVGTLSDVGNGLVIPPSEQPTATEMRIGIWVNNGYTVTGMNFKPMAIVGDSAEPYEPYENICPIIGWDDVWFGENLFHKKNILFGKNWINSSAVNRATVFMQMKKGAKYYYRIAYHGNAWDLGIVYGENSAIGQGQTFSWNTGMSVDTLNSHTATNTNAFFQFQWNDGGQTDPVQLTDVNTWDVFVSEVSDHPTSQTVPVKSISGSTVYGGKLTVKGDGSGELVVDRAMLTESSFTSVVSGVSAGGLHWTDKLDLTYTIGDGNSISSHLVKKEGNAGWASKTQCYDASDGKVIRVYCKSDNVSDFRKEMAGLQICYKTTPVTYSLTTNEVFTLLGTNHISCDAGEVTVTYHADPTLFITKKIAQALNA